MGVRLGLVSTYPPTQCGIATFTEALVRHLQRTGAQVDVVRLVDSPQVQVLPVAHQWVLGRPGAVRATALALNDHDVVVVQHEYGIYAGPDGQEVLDLVRLLDPPVVTVLHTVLTHPTPNQHRVLAELVERSAALVTMTSTARERLMAGWGVHPDKVVVIPHGATEAPAPTRVPAPGARPVVLTWGLLSEGKGIAWALRGLALMAPQSPVPRYRVVGRTHPRVAERDGETHRRDLERLTRQLRLTDIVEFEDRYPSTADLGDLIASADVVLLPYDSPEQVTSGVLTEAVAAGRPVISTAFPHAVELLSSGAGLIVPPRDPGAIATALTRVLTERELSRSMAAESRRLAVDLMWPAVARRYVELARSVRVSSLRAAV
jgi:polysaccharide biosynthesis protein PslF